MLALTTDAQAIRLLREHQTRLYRMARTMLDAKASCDIQDLVQVGWIGLIEAWHHHDESKGAAFWTFARYRVQGAMRDLMRDARLFPRSVGHDYQLESYEPELHDEVTGDELQDRDPAEIRRALDELPPKWRSIVALHCRRGLQLHIIGRLYGVSESRIAQIVARAFKLIRRNRS